MSYLALLYIVTAVVSIALAILIAHLAKLSSQPKITADKESINRYMERGVSDDALGKTIYEEINKFVDSMQQSKDISEKLVNVVSKELDKRINTTNQEISRKYEAVIEEKAKNEEIAWKKYDKVLTEKKKTEAVIRSIAEGLVVVDSQGKVIMMNPAAEKLLGVPKSDKIGESIEDNLKEEQLLSLVKGAPDREGNEIELVSQEDETKKTLRASSAVIENEYGQTVGMVSVLSDITKQKELDAMKANFIASVSHELRTPLVAIDKSVSLILSKAAGELTSAQEQFLSIAERNLKRLSLLINDLLDLSKLEAGKMELRKEPSSVDKIIKEVVDALNTWAKTKSITLEVNSEEPLPEVHVDPNRIIQVLNNLIGNAVKFTPNQGKIIIEAKLGASKCIEVSIQDTGIGIAKANLGKVFDKFYQVGERVPTDINGTGIGLSISKEIVELHGGKIWAESEVGYGAKFIFSLPL